MFSVTPPPTLCFFVLIMWHQKVIFCHIYFCMKNQKTTQYNLSKNVCFPYLFVLIFLLSNNTLHVLFYSYICYWNTFHYFSHGNMRNDGIRICCNHKDMTEHLQIRENLNCQMPIEKLYCSAGYEPCYCHHTSKRKQANNNNYVICTLCKCMVKRPIWKTKAIKKGQKTFCFFPDMLKKNKQTKHRFSVIFIYLAWIIFFCGPFHKNWQHEQNV